MKVGVILSAGALLLCSAIAHGQSEYALQATLQSQSAFTNTYGGPTCLSQVPSVTQIMYSEALATSVGWYGCMEYAVPSFCELEFSTNNLRTLCEQDRLALSAAWYNWDLCINDDYPFGMGYDCDPPGGWQALLEPIFEFQKSSRRDV